MCGMANSGKLFYGELTDWLLEAGFIQYQFQMSIYYKYASYGTKFVVLSYVYDCVYWYTYEALGKLFLGALGKILNVSFLVQAHWFMSFKISQMKDHYISVDQDRYANSIATRYLDNATVKKSKRFYKTTLSYDMIFTKDYASTSDEKVQNLTRELNIH